MFEIEEVTLEKQSTLLDPSSLHTPWDSSNEALQQAIVNPK